MGSSKQINKQRKKELIQRLAGKLHLIASRMAAELAQTQIVNIRSRMQRGLGLLDAPMPPYRPMTVEMRKRHGRQTDLRDLTFTGSMLRSIHATMLGPSRAKIAFSDAANIEKARKNQRIAQWFGFSQGDRDKLRELMKQILASLLR